MIVKDAMFAWDFDEESPEPQALAAHADSQPVGLVIALLDPGLPMARIDSLYVDPLWRRRDIGATLLSKMEAHLRNQDLQMVRLRYHSNEETTSYLEALLKKAGWSEPKTITLCYRFDLQNFHPPWYEHLETTLPPDHKTFPWHTLSGKERQHLQHLEAVSTFPSDVSPFKEAASPEWINSFGLRHKKEIIGWVITHRITPDTIRYTALYIHREYRLSSLAIRLLAKAIRHHQESPIRWGLFEAHLEESSKPWLAFIRKRLAPFACDSWTIKTCHHRL